MPAPDPNTRAHLEWLGFIQPNGLVVSAPALVKAGAILNRQDAEGQGRLAGCVDQRAVLPGRDPEPCVRDFQAFASAVLGWGFSSMGYAGTEEAPVPADLKVILPDYGETLHPDFAVRERDPRNGASPWQLLVQVLDAAQDFDKATTGAGGLEASPQGRAERLLRGTGVSAGVLFNGVALRVISAPRGESSGWMDFRFADLINTAGRPLCSALRLLLSEQRLLALPREQRLAALLESSRKYQNEVSERLSEQVLHALYELLRGFQAAHDSSGGELVREPLSEDGDRNDIYRGLLSVILRLVFLLYAEERGMLPEDESFARYYSLTGLYQRLREDAALNPDTMDQRFGAWAQLLVLFRLIHDGARAHRTGGAVSLPERRGALFDPDRFRFLEGRSSGGVRQTIERVLPPHISDGVVYRVLEKLLVLDGERISYRTLDVEQIGSVYETIMGFRLETATGRSVAIKPAKKLGAPNTIDLDALLAQPNAGRGRWLQERADRTITDKIAKGLRDAETVDDLHAALDRVLDKDATPDIAPPGALVLQPNEERRRSGSHYTPRELTEPIVRHTLAPLLDRLRGEDGRSPTPEQILDLKICDPAMGSGAFLVETCRQLADALIDAWGAHSALPVIPPDEDQVIYARRLVAQKCLYGIDRNPMAVDLAKVSLWLSTLARDHPLTFVDHAFRHGDSLVGLTRPQIEALHWKRGQSPVLAGFGVQEALTEASELRRQIRGADDAVSERRLQNLWHDAQDALTDVRLFADLVLAAFFEGSKPRDREARLAAYRAEILSGLARRHAVALEGQRNSELPFAPFHWEIEFPEVFERKSPGFDAIIGNPPFLNAINHDRNPAAKALYSITFAPFAVGAYDLCLLFWARTLLYLLRQSGRYGMLSPTALLSSTKDWKHWFHKNWRPDSITLNAVDTFSGARIRTAAICGGAGQPNSVTVIDREAGAPLARRPWSQDGLNWYEVIHATIDSTSLNGSRLQQFSESLTIRAGCTTADAYNLKTVVKDQRDGTGQRLVTTGAIDRYSLKWGIKATRYLKDDYFFPRWPDHTSHRGVQRAAERQATRKILVGGLTSVIEAWLDEKGDTAGVVQTWVVTPKVESRDFLWLYGMLGIINSARFSRIFVDRHGGSAMSGKQITIKKSCLLDMPIPIVEPVSESGSDDGNSNSTVVIPSIKEWLGAESSPAVFKALTLISRELLRLRPTHSENLAMIDKLGHYLAGALYGCSEEENDRDYEWWSTRSGVELCDKPVESIAEQYRLFAASLVRRGT